MTKSEKQRDNGTFVSFIALIIVGFWIIYSVYDYHTLGSQLRFLFFDEPFKFSDTLIFSVSTFSLVTRILVISICVIAAFLIRRSFLALQEKTEELKESRDKIRQSETRYRMLFDTNSDPIFMLKKWSISSFNRKALSLFECKTKQDLLDLPFFSLFPEHQTESARTQEFLEEIQTRIENQDLEIAPFDMICKTITGKEILCTLTLSPLLIDGTTYCQVVVRDISLQKQVEKELIEAKNEAILAEQYKNAFIALIGQEIKQPLATILQDCQRVPTTKTPELDSILSAGKNLLQLIDTMIDITNMETKKVSLEKEPIQLSSLLDSIKKSSQEEIGPKEILFQTHAPQEDPCLAVDQGILKKILSSLIDNAIQHISDKGSIEVFADITPYPPSFKPMLSPSSLDIGDGYYGSLKFQIIDSGKSIPPEEQKTIFQTFSHFSSSSSPHAVSKIGQLRLGVAKKMVDLLQGSITLKSESDHGNSITIVLPNIRILVAPVSAA